MEIEQKKQIISNLNQQLNQKSFALEETIYASKQVARYALSMLGFGMSSYIIYLECLCIACKRLEIVYNTNEEILNPSHTALVLWDVLGAFEKIIFNKEEFSKKSKFNCRIGTQIKDTNILYVSPNTIKTI